MKSLIKSLFRRYDYEISTAPPFLRRTFFLHPDRRTLGAISPDLLKPERWERVPAPGAPSGDLWAIFQTIPGGHKWHHYFPIYESVFGPLRSKPINVLEIGVYRGGSIRLWHKYFAPGTRFVGIDIDASCLQFDSPAENIHVRIGSQDDAAFLSDVVAEFGPFDLIIDDGSHQTGHIIASFNALFGPGLKDGGLYFVEDLHSNYWLSFRTAAVSFMDVAKSLIDLMHAHYVEAQDETSFRLNHPRLRSIFTVPRITRMIDQIRVFDSVVAIYKGADKTPPMTEHL